MKLSHCDSDRWKMSWSLIFATHVRLCEISTLHQRGRDGTVYLQHQHNLTNEKMLLQSKVSENPKPLEHLCWQAGRCFSCSFQSHRGLIIIFYSPCGPFFTFKPCRHQLLSRIHQSVTDCEAGESKSKMEFERAIYKRTPYFCPVLLIIPGFYMAYLKFAEVYGATKWWKVNRSDTVPICSVLGGTSFLLTFPLHHDIRARSHLYQCSNTRSVAFSILCWQGCPAQQITSLWMSSCWWIKW